MSIVDPQRRPDRDREMSDANISTTERAIGPDPLAPDARARGLARAQFTARGKAFRFPKGRSGNPDGQSRFYHACRQLAREASPEMMAGLIDLAKNAVDEGRPHAPHGPPGLNATVAEHLSGFGKMLRYSVVGSAACLVAGYTGRL